MKPRLRCVRKRCSRVIACCFSSWMNRVRGLCVTHKRKKKRNAFGCRTAWVEKGNGSYYSVVFNRDLIDPSIIHRDYQWAVRPRSVCNRRVSLSFPSNPFYEIQFMFFCVVFLFISIILLLFTLPRVDRANSIDQNRFEQTTPLIAVCLTTYEIINQGNSHDRSFLYFFYFSFN